MSKPTSRRPSPPKAPKPLKNASAAQTQDAGAQQQIAQGIAAVLEVCSGAPANRILELGASIEVGKRVLRDMLSGRIALSFNNQPGGQPAPQPTPAASPK